MLDIFGSSFIIEVAKVLIIGEATAVAMQKNKKISLKVTNRA